jgi:hypothetical protein
MTKHTNYLRQWWLIHVRDRIAQRVTEDAQAPFGTMKVYTDDWRKALQAEGARVACEQSEANRIRDAF